jgi:hypothetical protein
MGGEGQIVQADETYFGKTEEVAVSKQRRGRPYRFANKGPRNKCPIIALVERGGNIRTWHVGAADKLTIGKIVAAKIAKESRLHTDESRLYTEIGRTFAAHETVTHSHDEYVHYVEGVAIHTNSAEGFFSIFKRGMKGVYQHCSEKHLHRYLAEFDFRYNYRVARGINDNDRTIAAIRGGRQAPNLSSTSLSLISGSRR